MGCPVSTGNDFRMGIGDANGKPHMIKHRQIRCIVANTCDLFGNDTGLVHQRLQNLRLVITSLKDAIDPELSHPRVDGRRAASRNYGNHYTIANQSLNACAVTDIE